ncbi:MAG: hypothetical protein CMQ41_07795 [Gammaproteobacteria bacterium]|nr:hypothetical protein [Gammaproteobacteria bacterium]|tara:strand:- start:34 stop:381 length:348 start_codon:yes stop_codon:yes gene_type:complete
MWFGLTIFTIAVFGLSFLITHSFLFEAPRNLLADLNDKTAHIRVLGTLTTYISYLANCIVCSSVWVSILLMLIYDHSIILSNTLPDMLNLGDLPILIGWSAGTSWILGRATGITD